MKPKTSKLVALGAMVAIAGTSLGSVGIVPAQAAAHRGFVRRHPFITAGAAYLVYHHYHKKHMRARARQMNRRY